MPNDLGVINCSPPITEGKSRSKDEVRSATLTIKEMLRLLVAHDCADISSQIDPEGYSEIPLGQGGHGDVWKGRMRDGRDVAVKVWRQFPATHLSKVMKRTMQEIYYWSKIEHINIHELMGVTEWHGKLGVVSLWMEQGDLRGYINKNPEIDRYPWCIQVAAGVSYLHENGLIHGDLKASNVLLSKDNIAKISDFDCSIFSDCSLLFSATEGVRTSLRWAAPELMGGSEDEDEDNTIAKTKQSDVYALAMTLLEILTGKSPYTEYKRDFGVLKALSDKKPPKRPEALSESNGKYGVIWTLLLSCWNHDDMARPDAQTVLQRLQIYAEPPEVKGPPRVGPHMSVREMFDLLVDHGCVDLSSHIDDSAKAAAIILASDGFGDIWKCKLPNGTDVAIKTVRRTIIEGNDYKSLKRVVREIYTWSKLKHENIHELIGVIVFKGHYLGMVSEWMVNGNLHEYMQKNPHFDRHQTCIQISSGLQYIHDRDAVHGGIKSTNVLVSLDGTAKLTGFGETFMSELDIRFSEHTRRGVGTLRWMAPEQLLEGETNSKPADVYALGMTMLEIFSGNIPYAEWRADFQVLKRIVDGILPTRPVYQLKDDERGNKMWQLMLSCCKRDPAARPTASEVLESLNLIASIPPEESG